MKIVLKKTIKEKLDDLLATVAGSLAVIDYIELKPAEWDALDKIIMLDSSTESNYVFNGVTLKLVKKV